LGGLRLPDETKGLETDRFPFSEGTYNAELMREMNVASGDWLLRPMEPDILGEKLVLDAIRPSSPFDGTGTAIMRAAEIRAATSPEDASNLAAFRTRLFEDFPEAAIASGILKPPRPEAHIAVISSW